MELRPEWMGSTMLKQRNQSDFSLANEYHGYNWEDRFSGMFKLVLFILNCLYLAKQISG